MFSLTVGERYVDEQDPFLANGGEIEFYANWYSTTAAGVLRERVEVALPMTRSIVRFADRSPATGVIPPTERLTRPPPAGGSGRWGTG